ncbi:FkbM family methyltransferase [Sulfitobacter sp. G21635-S1]|uniref:FkbM family methyltransferase n=1 Tax=Sulfitobacter sp. G21635-S1 TaxID=3014043 RepID=UPI0022AF4266|nr:FkbM family methyltransferase [Sulfitobacter sp. G21635-S1]MCZ4255119.1 FkbM family methyltransferase [Sulfitobacter sp. G21635-S1]
MNALPHPTFEPVAESLTLEAMRAAFRAADRPLRQKLMAALPPAVVEFAGIRMYVDPRDNYTDRMIWLYGQPPEMKSLTALTEVVEGKNAFILDIGANCGAFAVPLAVAAGKGSRVIAFEPNPVMIGRLGHNVQLNGLGHMVRIEGCALGAERGEAMLNFHGNNFGQASLLPVKRRSRSGGRLVPVRPLLDFVEAAAGHDVSVLKIDVEGAEPAALGPLLAAGGWLPDVMLVETDHAADWDSDLLGMIEGLGFRAAMQAEQNTLFVR